MGILLAAATPALAKPAYVATTVNMRSAPGTTSEVVAKIPGGSLIDADNCTDGWCAVNWEGKSGFAIQTALDLSGRVPQQRRVARQGGPVVYEDDEPEYVVGGPSVYYGPRPYYYGYGPYYRGGWGWRHRW
ncbi:MAG TPA: SH3 domain-containing protein [Pseudolabrys sp.]